MPLNQTIKFIQVKTKRELAEVLEVEYKHLIYYLHILPENEKYTTYRIKKRNGGERLINAPIYGIKKIQERLSQILLEYYRPKSCVHGFCLQKSIITNAYQHLNKKVVVNIDLEDFFPTINFGRIQGIFRKHPFNFNDVISTTLAQLCCHDKQLPQGAPTSPILSNFIALRMDNHLLKLATENRCTYTRYADDITISTNVFPLPDRIGNIKENNIVLSYELKNIVLNNGFKINERKIRFAKKNNRQEVTGIIVNNKKLAVNRKYIRNIRAILNAWEKYGLENVANEHYEKYDLKNKLPSNSSISFVNMIVGKIGFVGWVIGRNAKIYKKLYTRIKKLEPQVKLWVSLKGEQELDKPIIFCEGKTDSNHLNAALNSFHQSGLFLELDIVFKDYKSLKMNNSELLNVCETLSKVGTHRNKVICIFDRDDKKINKSVVDGNGELKEWGNNVFSVLIPKPNHRNFNEITIEHLYSNEELTTPNEHGRRLYLSDEFDPKTKKHKINNLIHYKGKRNLGQHFPFIIDSDVFDNQNVSMAMSKNDFSQYIFEMKAPFNNINFENFKSIFQTIEKIVSLRQEQQ